MQRLSPTVIRPYVSSAVAGLDPSTALLTALIKKARRQKKSIWLTVQRDERVVVVPRDDRGKFVKEKKFRKNYRKYIKKKKTKKQKKFFPTLKPIKRKTIGGKRTDYQGKKQYYDYQYAIYDIPRTWNDDKIKNEIELIINAFIPKYEFVNCAVYAIFYDGENKCEYRDSVGTPFIESLDISDLYALMMTAIDKIDAGYAYHHIVKITGFMIQTRSNYRKKRYVNKNTKWKKTKKQRR